MDHFKQVMNLIHGVHIIGDIHCTCPFVGV